MESHKTWVIVNKARLKNLKILENLEKTFNPAFEIINTTVKTNNVQLQSN